MKKYSLVPTYDKPFDASSLVECVADFWNHQPNSFLEFL